MMNDNDIKKALECCKKRNCGDCSYNAYGTSCSNIIASDTLDLINRQQAEIERLTVNKNACALGMKRLAEQLEQAKSEAIKEFAERLKGKFLGEYKTPRAVIKGRIDDLVKEMTEVQE